MRHVHLWICVWLMVAMALPALAQEPTWPDAPAGARMRADGWFPARVGTVARPVLPEALDNVVIIPIHGEIRYRSSSKVFAQQVARARASGAQMVILELDTPGGSTADMEGIANTIINELGDIYTVAYVKPNAISAGAFVSVACDEIVMTDSGMIGDAMPIMVGSGGIQEIPENERGKIESFLRGDIRRLATRNGYSVPLCEGMITLTHRIWLIRNDATGELRLINADDEAHLLSDTPGEPLYIDPEMADWVMLRIVDDERELVTLTAQEAYSLGLIDHTLNDYDELKGHYTIIAEPVRYELTTGELLAYFMSGTAVTSILTSLAILLVIIEVRTPGIGLPIIGALICFAILLGSHYMVGLAHVWELALILAGIGLIVLEIFVIPGFGLAGIMGLMLMLFGLMAILIPNAPTELPIPITPGDWSSLVWGIFGGICSLVAAVIAILLLMPKLNKMPLFRQLALAAVEPYNTASVTDHSPIMDVQVGDVGVVEAMCRPVGKARFGESLLDVVAEGEYIDAGRSIRLVRMDGNRLIVEPEDQA
jgi:membrane-bound serine protease (ClpP class)